MAFQFIEFQKTRDFSNKMNATFEFVKQNFKPLFRVMLYIVGPPALIVSLLLGTLMTDYMKAIFGMTSGRSNITDMLTIDLAIKVVLAVAVGTITSVISVAAINGYVVLYREKQSNQIEVEEVWDYVKKTFWLYFWSMLGFVALAIVAYGILLIPSVALFSAVPVLAVFAVFGVMGLFAYLLVANSLVLIVRGFEPTGFFESFSRSMFLTRGKWWSTFGLSLILYLIVSVTSSVFFMPWYFSKIVSSLHNIKNGNGMDLSTDWFGIISTAFQYLASYLLSVLVQVGLIFQYFNLVERKESRGLMEKMGGLGTGEVAPTNTQTEHY